MSVNWEIDYYNGDNGVLRAHPQRLDASSPIIKLRSGLPFTVTNGNVDANLDGNTNDRAQLIGDPAHRQPDGRDQWFNTAAFVQNKVVTGVADRRQLAAQPARRPGLQGRRPGRLARLPAAGQGQADLPRRGTNVFNIVNLGQPGNSVPSGATSTTFGVIRTANAMRRMQLGVRLTF